MMSKPEQSLSEVLKHLKATKRQKEKGASERQEIKPWIPKVMNTKRALQRQAFLRLLMSAMEKLILTWKWEFRGTAHLQQEDSSLMKDTKDNAFKTSDRDLSHKLEETSLMKTQEANQATSRRPNLRKISQLRTLNTSRMYMTLSSQKEPAPLNRAQRWTL